MASKSKTALNKAYETYKNARTPQNGTSVIEAAKNILSPGQAAAIGNDFLDDYAGTIEDFDDDGEPTHFEWFSDTSAAPRYRFTNAINDKKTPYFVCAGIAYGAGVFVELLSDQQTLSDTRKKFANENALDLWLYMNTPTVFDHNNWLGVVRARHVGTLLTARSGVETLVADFLKANTDQEHLRLREKLTKRLYNIEPGQLLEDPRVKKLQPPALLDVDEIGKRILHHAEPLAESLIETLFDDKWTAFVAVPINIDSVHWGLLLVRVADYNLQTEPIGFAEAVALDSRYAKTPDLAPFRRALDMLTECGILPRHQAYVPLHTLADYHTEEHPYVDQTTDGWTCGWRVGERIRQLNGWLNKYYHTHGLAARLRAPSLSRILDPNEGAFTKHISEKGTCTTARSDTTKIAYAALRTLLLQNWAQANEDDE